VSEDSGALRKYLQFVTYFTRAHDTLLEVKSNLILLEVVSPTRPLPGITLIVNTKVPVAGNFKRAHDTLLEVKSKRYFAI
jgi:hypothetical protein